MYMPDYKKIYLTLLCAPEEAVNLLIDALRECKELYMDAPDPELKSLTLPENDGEGKE